MKKWNKSLKLPLTTIEELQILNSYKKCFDKKNTIIIIIIIIIIITIIIIVVIIINFIIIIIVDQFPLVTSLFEVLWDEENKP